ncbi:PAS domain-containing sensor histidine kinase [Aeoliella sp. SH292]|uniref:PAS domain-containing sensor histidine kinase n=1 Tax=Aeoliella sp. SH292 TaxID=3454464 RepID=UPI003F946226
MSPDWSELRYVEGQNFVADTREPSKSWLDKYIPPSDRPRLLATIQRMVQEHRTFELEHRVIRADGSIGWAHSRAIPLLDEKGMIIEWFGAASDITDRKRIEQDADEARVYAESIVETLHEPLLVLHSDLRVKSVNRAFYDHFKVNPADTLGSRIYDLGNGQWDIPELRILLEEVLSKHRIFKDHLVEHDFESIGPRVMLLNARRLDTVELLLLGIRDITDRFEVERVSRQSDERYRELVSQVADYAIFRTDVKGRPITWNEGVERMLGFSQDEFIGTDIKFTIFTPEDIAVGIPEQEFDTAARTGTANNDRWMCRKSGMRFYAQGVTSAIRGDHGELVGFTKVMRDHTSLKNAEDALRESEQRLRAVVHQASTGVVQADARGRITLVNRRWCEMLGYEESELLGTTILDVTEPEYRDATRRAVEELANGGADFEIEKRYRRKDGSGLWATSSVAALRDPNGLYEGLVAVVLDITERKRAEEALLQLNETLEQQVAERTAVAERRARDLSRLAEQLSATEHRERIRLAKLLHDHLQQSLVGARYLLSAADNEHALERRGILQRLDELLSECITTSHNLTQELSPPILQIGTIAQILEWLGERGKQRYGLSTVVKCHDEFPTLPQHVRIFIFEAVREMLFNVVKHSGRAEATIDAYVVDHTIVVQVQDSGSNFDPAALRSRLERPDTFGLFHIRERVEALGGSLGFEVAVNGGARFRIVLPALATAVVARQRG